VGPDVDDIAGPAERSEQDQAAAEQRAAVAPVQCLRIEDDGKASEAEADPDRAVARDGLGQEHGRADRDP
jgi:hypothetical protein